MTSVNLVSPNDNGNLYSVRFKEPLVIEPNSNVSLNFAKFKRNGNIFFSKDQTITLTLNGVKPSLKPVAPFTQVNTALDNLGDGAGVLKITKVNPDTGKAGYSVEELDKRIKTLFDNYQLRDTDKPTQFFNYEGIEFDNTNKNLIRIGYIQKNPLNKLQDITLSTNDVKGGAVANGNAYEKTSADAAVSYYDNYALSKEHYNFNYSSPLGIQTVKSRNLIHFKVNKKLSEQGKAVSIGLGSKEIGNSDWTDNTTSNTTALTRGTGATNNSANGTAMSNPAVYAVGSTQMPDADKTDAAAEDNILASFFTIEITGGGGTVPKQLHVYMPKCEGETSTRFTNMSKEIVEMEEVFSTHLSAFMNNTEDQAVELAVETYWLKNSTLNVSDGRFDRMYFRVYNMVGVSSYTNDNLIFDSKRRGKKYGINNQWFQSNGGGAVGTTAITGTNAQKENKINCSLPFNIIMSAQKQGEGFEFVRATSFNKDDDNATATNPQTFINRYSMAFSDELASYLGTKTTTPNINPNFDEPNVVLVQRQDAELVRDTSYSIFMKNLPIKCYRNIQKSYINGNQSSQGFVQPILYDVPTPFADSQIVNVGDGDIVVGTYQPSINKVLTLDNNRLVLNNLDVEIRDTETNEIAKELTGSVINFTISK